MVAQFTSEDVCNCWVGRAGFGAKTFVDSACYEQWHRPQADPGWNLDTIFLHALQPWCLRASVLYGNCREAIENET